MFPTLAIYNGPATSYLLPRVKNTKINSYGFLNTGDTVVLVKQNELRAIPCVLYYIPLVRLLTGEFTMSAICRWPARYLHLPWCYSEYFWPIQEWNNNHVAGYNPPPGKGFFD